MRRTDLNYSSAFVPQRQRLLQALVVSVGIFGAETSTLLAGTVSVPGGSASAADPRVVYVGSISKPSDIGAKQGAFKKLAGWVAGAASESHGLVRPFGLSLDETGGLLVTDTGANAIFYLHRRRKTWLRWDSAGKIPFLSPVAAVRRDGMFFVADSSLGKVIAFDEKGKVRFEITGELQRPSGLAIFGDKMFIIDSQLHQVVVYDVTGRPVGIFGRRGPGPGEFNFPTHVALDALGQVLVTDALNCRVQVLASDGQFKQAIGGPGDAPGHFSRPKGVAGDSSGHIYVVDSVLDNVQMFDKDGNLLLSWGQSGSSPGEFWLPNAVVVNDEKEIYVADCYNGRIQIFKYTGRE